MRHAQSIGQALSTLLAFAVFASIAAGDEPPQLAETGILVTEAASRSRLGSDEFYVGDLLYVQVKCSPNSGETSVSAHMEYKKPSGEWAPVPTSSGRIGKAYMSGNYAGLRDYVRLVAVTQHTRRNISLFMPYDAAAMPNGTYSRRYVIRLWHNNQDVARIALPGEKVTVDTMAGRTVIKVVECKACCAAVASSDAPLKPEPASVGPGAVHFFDARKGNWTCPAKLERQPE